MIRRLIEKLRGKPEPPGEVHCWGIAAEDSEARQQRELWELQAPARQEAAVRR
jgi:hypothetical protein